MSCPSEGHVGCSDDWTRGSARGEVVIVRKIVGALYAGAGVMFMVACGSSAGESIFGDPNGADPTAQGQF